MDIRIDTAHEDGTNHAVVDLPHAAVTEPVTELPVQEAMRVNPVCGEPISAHGVTLVTVARIGGGVRGRIGRSPKGRGGSSGFAGKPVGAYVLSEGTVRWQPAVDVNRLVLALAALAAVALLTRRRAALPRSRADRFLP
jgi:uncharacterized spore protein YtfJ